MKRLVDRYEQMTHDALKPVIERFSLSIYPKVRVADVVDPNALGVTGDLKTFALKSHFDFVICRDRWDPAYAIEFDGAAHATERQRVRDVQKDELCRRADLPILRVGSNHLTREYSHLTLLGWLVEVAEMQLAFDAEQAAGRISDEEDFDPFFMMSMEPGEPRFPYWISAMPRIRLERLAKQGRIIQGHTSGFVGTDAAGVYRGIELIKVTDTDGVFVETAMRPQQFPAPFSDLLGEILAVQLADRVAGWLDGREGSAPMEAICRRADEMRKSLHLYGWHAAGEVADRWRNG